MRLGFVAALIGLGVGIAGAGMTAQAQLTVCNKTPAPLNLAIAFETVQDVLSQGWWTIAPDKCEPIIPTPLTQAYIYHYAKSDQLNVEWAGTYNFCTQNNPEFRIPGGMDCEARSYRSTGFRQIDLQGAKAYTLDITAGPIAAPPAVAAPSVETPVEVIDVPVPEAQPAAPAAPAGAPASAPVPTATP